MLDKSRADWGEVKKDSQVRTRCAAACHVPLQAWVHDRMLQRSCSGFEVNGSGAVFQRNWTLVRTR